MVPISLRLRNFLCYRDNAPPLSFNGFRVACLSGSNGHGKSALLDAMSWALWGRARARSNEDLVYYGQTEMEVEFEFGMGDEHYRVLRKYSRPRTKSGAGQTVLELQVAHDGAFRPITGNTLRDTEKRIEELLRLDYETFINSSCLLQGRADEFTNKRPNERKKILADILGLDYYDRLEDRAKAERDEWQRTIHLLDEELAAIDREVAGRPELLAREKEIATELDRLELIQKSEQAQLDAARSAQSRRDAERRRHQDIENRLRGLRTDQTRFQTEAERTRKKIGECEAIIARAADIEAAVQEHQRVSAEVAAWDERRTEHLRLTAERDREQHAIALARQNIEGQLHNAEGLVARNQKRAGGLPQAEAQLAGLAAREAALQDSLAQLEQDRATVQELADERQQHQAEKQRLRAEMDGLAQRINLLKGDDDACWLCGNPLGAQGKQHIQDVCQKDGEAKKEQYRQHETAARDLDARSKKLQSGLDSRAKALQAEQGAVQTDRGRLTQLIEQCREAATDLAKAQVEVERCQAVLAREEYAAEHRQRLKAIGADLARLTYDPAGHDAARARLTELAGAEREQWQLDQARTQIDAERETLKSQQELIATRQEQITAEEAALREVEQILAEFSGLDADIAERERALRDADLAVGRAREALGGVRQQLQATEAQEARRPAKHAELVAARNEKALYDDLVLAFGKRGIQAMIIDAVLPEIEEEANSLLGRMSDFRMHVSFDTQRESKRGSAIETLDIRVSDELGTRPYEMFSGGEAFRINFAVRIALSRLLARRAGARLQTLIIDEGFGTQDASGREKLVEAINSVQSDFEKILVITHVDELKDLFNTRIDVVKGETGSYARVA